MDTKEELHNKTLGTTLPPPPTGGDQGADGGGGGGEEDQNEPKSPAAPTAPLPLESPTVAGAAGSPTNLQKKVRRAERFGVPVQLSEEEKRNSRAERFGTAPSSQGNSEEQKRKARAERFGTAGNSTADEEAKKKARLARFAPDIKLDSVEEEKRKARAIRFAQTTSSALSHMNGKSESDRKTLNVDKTNEGT